MHFEIPSPAQVGLIGTAGVDTLTGGAITANILEDMVIWGLTFGAWVKLFLAISVLLIILMNIPKVIMNWKKLYKGE